MKIETVINSLKLNPKRKFRNLNWDSETYLTMNKGKYILVNGNSEEEYHPSYEEHCGEWELYGKEIMNGQVVKDNLTFIEAFIALNEIDEKEVYHPDSITEHKMHIIYAPGKIFAHCYDPSKEEGFIYALDIKGDVAQVVSGVAIPLSKVVSDKREYKILHIETCNLIESLRVDTSREMRFDIWNK